MLRIMFAVAIAATLTTGAVAQTAAPKTATTTTTTTTKKPGMAARTTTAKMATHTTASGKKITYDCSKKGNMNKAACKK